MYTQKERRKQIPDQEAHQGYGLAVNIRRKSSQKISVLELFSVTALLHNLHSSHRTACMHALLGEQGLYKLGKWERVLLRVNSLAEV